MTIKNKVEIRCNLDLKTLDKTNQLQRYKNWWSLHQLKLVEVSIKKYIGVS